MTDQTPQKSTETSIGLSRIEARCRECGNASHPLVGQYRRVSVTVLTCVLCGYSQSRSDAASESR